MSSNNEIKIFVDAHVFDGEFQGTRTYLQELYTRLVSLRPDATFYFGANDVRNLESIFSNYENVRFVRYSSSNSIKRIFFEIPDIVEEIGCTHAHFQYMLPLRLKQNCKYIVTIHDILFNDFPSEFSLLYRLQRNLLFRRSARVADVLLTVSSYSRERMVEKYGIPASSILVTPNAVAESFLGFNYSKPESRSFMKKNFSLEKYILFVSRIEQRKNQNLLLGGFINHELGKQGFRLVFVGSDTFGSHFQEKVNEANRQVPDSVYWFNQLENMELMHFYNGAEFFVYPSSAEGFGIPPLEAACMQTPVLCSNSTAMQEFYFFQPFTFNPDEVEIFYECLQKMADLYQLIDTAAIRHQIVSRYSWDKTAEVFTQSVIV